MELTDDNCWTWQPFWDEHDNLVDKHNDLVKRWNRIVPIVNAGSRDVGRPLAASDAQVAAVLKLHKAGKSLRGIVDETSLSLQTVRTIVGRKNGTDRTTKGWVREDRDREVSAWALEITEAIRRRTAEAGRDGDRDGQGAGTGSQGAGPGTLRPLREPLRSS